MKLLAIIPVLLLAGIVHAAPTSNDDKVVIDKDFFPDSLVKYTSQHDIVTIYVPLNALNFEDDSDDDDNDDTNSDSVLFFVEADIQPGSVKDYKGLYILKNGKATLLLPNGRDASASNDDTTLVYFGASDGLYVYNAKTNTADKYGSVTDSITNVAKENGTDALYILTDSQDVYRVTDDGNKINKVDEIRKAEEIVLDYSNNLYYYGADKQPRVVNADGVRTFEGLPQHPTYVRLLRPPFVIEDGVPFVADDKTFIIYANGTVENSDFVLDVKPTAYSMEATLIQYYAYNKKIYEYNVLIIILSEMLEGLKSFLDNMKDNIESIATRSRSDLRA